MAIDWDAELLGPVMAVFGEGDPDDPASWPVYSPKGGRPFPLAGAVFDSAYHRVVELADGSTSTTIFPVLGVRAALFPAPPLQNDSVYIPSAEQAYGIGDVEPDGHGHIKLILIEVALP